MIKINPNEINNAPPRNELAAACSSCSPVKFILTVSGGAKFFPAAIIFAIGSIFAFLQIQNQDHETINADLTLFILAVSVAYSMYLIWKAGKLKSIFTALFLYVVINFIGTMQTLLPVQQAGRSVDERLVLYGIIFIGVLLLVGAIISTTKPKALWKKLMIFGGCLIGGVLVSIFPFAEYYSIQTVKLDNIIVNQVITLVLFVILVIVDKIISRIFKRKI